MEDGTTEELEKNKTRKQRRVNSQVQVVFKHVQAG